MNIKLFAVLLGVLLLLAGCASESPAGTTLTSEQTPAVQALEAHLQALVDKDEETFVQYTCADWEENALLEYDAFGSVDTSLDGLACEQTGTSNGTATVVCQGKILASYQDEVQEFDLSGRTYQLIDQNGDWLVCGY